MWTLGLQPRTNLPTSKQRPGGDEHENGGEQRGSNGEGLRVRFFSVY